MVHKIAISDAVYLTEGDPSATNYDPSSSEETAFARTPRSSCVYMEKSLFRAIHYFFGEGRVGPGRASSPLVPLHFPYEDDSFKVMFVIFFFSQNFEQQGYTQGG